jgi:hypothetical protein
MVFVPLKDRPYCMHENSKNRSLQRMAGPDYMLAAFFDFFARSQKSISHRCDRPCVVFGDAHQIRFLRNKYRFLLFFFNQLPEHGFHSNVDIAL